MRGIFPGLKKFTRVQYKYASDEYVAREDARSRRRSGSHYVEAQRFVKGLVPCLDPMVMVIDRIRDGRCNILEW